jgi:hypothetical protein
VIRDLESPSSLVVAENWNLLEYCPLILMPVSLPSASRHRLREGPQSSFECSSTERKYSALVMASQMSLQWYWLPGRIA